MPELPEIEHLRLSLEPALVGRRVRNVALRRPDIVRAGASRAPLPNVTAAQLGADDRVRSLERKGKELAIFMEKGTAILVHLGMSGRLTHVEDVPDPDEEPHMHCIWTTDHGALVFQDPRRFGGIWPFPTREELLAQRWNRLGPDALNVNLRQLRDVASRSTRAIKALLLDQGALAGVGNIYADESLFRAQLHPERPANSLTDDELRRLAAAVRWILRRAVAWGGSTLRDYRDGQGQPGRFARLHRVYGRAGAPCPSCREPLVALTVAQRTTTICPHCQPQ